MERGKPFRREYLFWFHHACRMHLIHSGRTLWDELSYKYDAGIESTRWKKLKKKEQPDIDYK